MQKDLAISAERLNLWYGDFQSLCNVNMKIAKGNVTSIIGPSGCGKSTLLRTFNRINERIANVKISGSVHVLGHDIFQAEVELAQLRKRVGMVFQRPNPLPISIRNNILFSYNVHRNTKKMSKSDLDDIVEDVLRQVQLWNNVKDQLSRRATELSLEKQQKLCIARLLPVHPSIFLMDEPCSALDPKGTEAIEELIVRMKEKYTVLIVTHNMSQAKRVSDDCIFMLMGKVLENASTKQLFSEPKLKQTEDYIEGRYG